MRREGGEEGEKYMLRLEETMEGGKREGTTGKNNEREREGGREGGLHTDGGEVHGLHGGGHPLPNLPSGAGINDGYDGKGVRLDVVAGKELLSLWRALVPLGRDGRREGGRVGGR